MSIDIVVQRPRHRTSFEDLIAATPSYFTSTATTADEEAFQDAIKTPLPARAPKSHSKRHGKLVETKRLRMMRAEMSSNSRLNKLRFFNFIKTLLEELPHLRPLYYNWQSPTTFKEHAAKIRVHEFTIPGLARDHVIKLTVTEDMCPESIDHLWLAFGCPSPELFGLHLDNQKSLGSYNGIYSSQINEWYDPGFAKRYYSIRWYRPGLYRQDSLGYQYEELVKSVYNDIRTLPRVAAMNNSSRWSPFFMTRDGEKLRNAFRPQEIFSNSNILRKSIMLPVDTDELKKRDTAGCPCLWEERATIYVTKERNDSKMLFLLDPIPTVSVAGVYKNTADSVEDSQRLSESCIVDMLLFKPLRRKRHPGRIGVNFFEGMDVKHTQNLILDAQRPNSTSEDIFSALEYPAIDGKFKNIRDPVSALMIIISRDTNDTFSILHTTLDRISEASLDEVKLQEHLKSWRDQLESTRKLASGLVKDFESFASEIISKKYATNSRSLTALVDEVKNNGRTVTTKVWRVTKGLRAEMSLLESRRGIAEAESVTRLTELAFIFIPLTFVSSIFSMQVNELSSGVPFSTFLIAASCATVLLYGTRLFLRSRPFVTCRRLFMDKARIWAHVPKGEPIPFLQFFFFCIRILFIIFRTPIRALWRMSRISTLSPFKRRKSGGALPSDSAKTAEV